MEREKARAAIAVMRKPTPADAEVWACPCCGQVVDRQAMNAAALEESDG